MTQQKAVELLLNYFNWCPDCINHEHSENKQDCSECMCKATELAVEAINERDSFIDEIISFVGNQPPCNFNNMDEFADCDFCRANCSENCDIRNCWENALKEKWCSRSMNNDR